jgi:hypothetical protein
MSTPSSNYLNYLSAAMPVALPIGFARPPTPPAPNTTQRVQELEERVVELEIENDRLKTGMHNFNVDRNEADDRIDDLEKQVGDLFSLVMRMNAPCTCTQSVNGHDAMIG